MADETMIERLHRQFLEVVKAELDRLGVEDINNVQALILSHVGGEELTVGELTYRGYYLGSNVSYNVKKMMENDYLIQERSAHDRRWVRGRVGKSSGMDGGVCGSVPGAEAISGERTRLLALGSRIRISPPPASPTLREPPPQRRG